MNIMLCLENIFDFAHPDSCLGVCCSIEPQEQHYT